MKKKLKYKIIFSILLIFIIIIIILFNFMGRNRDKPIQTGKSSPIEAVKSAPSIKGDIKVIGEVNRVWAKVYLLETQDGIKTAVTEKKGLLWNCSLVTYIFDDIIKNDEVKTIGWASFSEENNKYITVFAVQTTDPNVKYIEAGTNSDRQRKAIGLNETVIFTWDKTISTDMNAIAFDKDNFQLYKYEFNPKHVGFADSKELRWYSINNR